MRLTVTPAKTCPVLIKVRNINLLTVQLDRSYVLNVYDISRWYGFRFQMMMPSVWSQKHRIAQWCK